MSARVWTIIGLFSVSIGAGRANSDELLYRYDGDVVPYDPSAGWVIYNPCEEPCSEHVEDGHFVLRWPEAGDRTNYQFWIAQVPVEPPPTLWVEWRFRSNHPMPPNFYTCDANFKIRYAGMFEKVYMYGDAAVSRSAGDYVLGLDLHEFQTYRFESLDGINYWIGVDGHVFIVDAEDNPDGYHSIALRGRGGCFSDQIPNMVNEWDFVRFGTISYGEQIIASDPPAGFLNARQHAGLDRFTITFDSPNYVYLDEIAVEVTDGVAPQVIQTRRRDNGEPDTVEIVLDRPMAFGETTSFTFDDGEAVNVVEYTFAPGDTDGDGDADLHDFALFQTCFGQSCATGPCAALDLDANARIGLLDYALFHDLLATQ